MTKHVIVSRHPAAVSFIRAECPEFADAEVLASATAEQVRDAIIAGNLPLHLAVEAREVWAVEFAGSAPRGAEYGLDEMRAAGARIAKYAVAHRSCAGSGYEHHDPCSFLASEHVVDTQTEERVPVCVWHQARCLSAKRYRKVAGPDDPQPDGAVWAPYGWNDGWYRWDWMYHLPTGPDDRPQPTSPRP